MGFGSWIIYIPADQSPDDKHTFIRVIATREEDARVLAAEFLKDAGYGRDWTYTACREALCVDVSASPGPGARTDRIAEFWQG
jgi:hypothetical protein